MAWRVNHLRLETSPPKNVAFLHQLIHFSELRRVHAKERGLIVHRLIKWQIVAVHQHGRAGVLMQFAQSTDVIDVRVRADDDFYNELMTAEQVQDAIDFIARVHHQRFARGRITDDLTIALQHPHRDCDVDQSLGGGVESRSIVTHKAEYIIGAKGIFDSRCMPYGALW